MFDCTLTLTSSLTQSSFQLKTTIKDDLAAVAKNTVKCSEGLNQVTDGLKQTVENQANTDKKVKILEGDVAVLKYKHKETAKSAKKAAEATAQIVETLGLPRHLTFTSSPSSKSTSSSISDDDQNVSFDESARKCMVISSSLVLLF